LATTLQCQILASGSDYNAVVILTAEGQRENLPRMPKRAIADHLLDVVAQRLEGIALQKKAKVSK